MSRVIFTLGCVISIANLLYMYSVYLKCSINGGKVVVGLLSYECIKPYVP